MVLSVRVNKYIIMIHVYTIVDLKFVILFSTLYNKRQQMFMHNYCYLTSYNILLRGMRGNSGRF